MSDRTVPAHRPLLIAILLLTASALAGRAHAAAESALDHIDPRVDRAAFAMFLDRINMDDDQQAVARMLYDDYGAEIEALAAELDRQAEEAGRARVEEALAGNIYLEPQELRRLRADVLRTYQSGWDRADELFEDLIVQTHVLLMDQAAAEFEPALRRLKREVFLHPRAADGQDEAYAGEGVDVIRLVKEAMMPGGELESLDRSALDGILTEYARQVDALLTTTAAADRRGRMNYALARIERDRSAMRDEEQAALSRWQRLYQINRQTVQQIAAAIGQSLGAAAQQRWLARFDRACFPWLFDRTMPDRQADWIARRVSDEEIVQKAQEIHAAYITERATLRRETIDLILRARLTFRIMVHSRMDSSALNDAAARELYQDLLKNSGRRAKLDSDTSDGLEALLTERQRRQMRSDIAAASYGRRRP
ncbi:MAG: hypothetical protein SYC29_04455 [Planctomycetota bacterium]|nr:hypothetical protein [Planctomycetota bacterium]